MARILLRAGKSPFEVIDPITTLDKNLIGNNSGNLLFAQSVYKAMYVPGSSIDVTRYKADEAQADEINEKYDVFVLPFANAFRGSFEKVLRAHTALIKKLKIPCVVVGIGAQTDLNFSQLKGSPVDEAVKDFAAAILDKSASIGVRGEFTREYLNKLGFSAVDTIGCPSMYLNGENLSVKKPVDLLTADSPIAVNITSRKGMVLADFFKRALQQHSKAIYVPQDMEDAHLLLWGKTRGDVGVADGLPNSLTSLFINSGAARFFTDVPTWISFMRQQHFSIGTRIHGNVFALLAGTPGYVIAHDSRTLEMSEYYEIPHIRGDKVNETTTVADLYAEADYGPMTKNHGERFAKFKSFLEKNGLDHAYKNSAYPAAFDSEVAKVSFPAPIDVVTHSQDLSQRLIDLNSRFEEKFDRIVARLKKVEAKQAKAGAV